MRHQRKALTSKHFADILMQVCMLKECKGQSKRLSNAINIMFISPWDVQPSKTPTFQVAL